MNNGNDDVLQELSEIEAAEARANLLPLDLAELGATLAAHGFGAATARVAPPPAYMEEKTGHLLVTAACVTQEDVALQYIKVISTAGDFGLVLMNLNDLPEYYLDLTDTGIDAKAVEPDEDDVFTMYSDSGVDIQVCVITLDLKNMARFAKLLGEAKVRRAKAHIDSVEID